MQPLVHIPHGVGKRVFVLHVLTTGAASEIVLLRLSAPIRK